MFYAPALSDHRKFLFYSECLQVCDFHSVLLYFQYETFSIIDSKQILID